MHRGFLITAFIFGALAVAFGAFGAHALKELVSQRVIVTFETAVRYQFYHVFALIVTAVLYKEFTNKWIKAAGWLFITGLVLFCISLYMLCYVQATVQPGYKWLGPVTPVGGFAFIAGWISMMIGVVRGK
jgi:uncharacterized membrane protein YgdD (TMEM256/DUF423 family)